MEGHAFAHRKDQRISLEGEPTRKRVRSTSRGSSVLLGSESWASTKAPRPLSRATWLNTRLIPAGVWTCSSLFSPYGSSVSGYIFAYASRALALRASSSGSRSSQPSTDIALLYHWWASAFNGNRQGNATLEPVFSCVGGIPGLR